MTTKVVALIVFASMARSKLALMFAVITALALSTAGLTADTLGRLMSRLPPPPPHAAAPNINKPTVMRPLGDLAGMYVMSLDKSQLLTEYL